MTRPRCSKNKKRVVGLLAAASFSVLSFHIQACEVDYSAKQDWGSGAQLSVKLTNNSVTPINGFDLTWMLATGEALQNGWGATFTSNGATLTASGAENSYEGKLAPNQTRELGLIITKQKGNSVNLKADFYLNGVECNKPGGGPTDPTDPSKAISAVDAASAMGKGFNIGQTFDNDQHPRTFASVKAKIDAYYAQGYRNVRIPITWTEKIGGTTLVHNPETGHVNFDHPRLKVIKALVDYALTYEDLYVVINTHHEKKLKDDDNWQALENLWKDISTLFKGSDYRLMYEILNEPHKSYGTMPAMDNTMVRLMSEKAYNQIRAVEDKRIVIIGGNRWFAANELAEVWPNLDAVGGGKDNHVMATFHHYNPWSFHGDNQGDYSDDWNESHISDPMDMALNWSKTIGNNMPIYIGEWGTGWGSRYTKMTCNNIRHWYQLFDKSFASVKGIPTSVWDDGGWFKIFDHATNQYDNNLYQCIGGTCEWDADDSRFNEGCI